MSSSPSNFLGSVSVRIDEVQLQQVLVDLIINGMDAMTDTCVVTPTSEPVNVIVPWRDPNPGGTHPLETRALPLTSGETCCF